MVSATASIKKLLFYSIPMKRDKKKKIRIVFKPEAIFSSLAHSRANRGSSKTLHSGSAKVGICFKSVYLRKLSDVLCRHKIQAF